MSNVQIHPFNTQPPETPFAPYWNYVIACKKTDIDGNQTGMTTRDSFFDLD